MGSGAKGYANLSKLFDFVIQLLLQGKGEADILKSLKQAEEHNFFKRAYASLTPRRRRIFLVIASQKYLCVKGSKILCAVTFVEVFCIKVLFKLTMM